MNTAVTAPRDVTNKFALGVNSYLCFEKQSFHFALALQTRRDSQVEIRRSPI
jgi:hypothetical protein